MALLIPLPKPGKDAGVIPAPEEVTTNNQFLVLDSIMDDLEKDERVGDKDLEMDDSMEFFELNRGTIKNVLKVNPKSLDFPGRNEANVTLDINSSDDEVPDFDITNAQKLAIMKRLEKFGSVKASAQANWDQGEWDYFRYQLKSLNIDPSTAVEDVDSDSNGTAVFFKPLLRGGNSGGVVNQDPKNINAV
ncbi:hypothetical protein L1987_50220 [Smallanthus sonchifolius]|uniref:Uncharacterized protein n=1 Tax=Smallanthus sonchifolius TaxID=185202 RepID=A0ACB9FWW2_9ASTR|nr:hypothetical protein L1987_50220 [Smallanthus sonchifolius]